MANLHYVTNSEQDLEHSAAISYIKRVIESKKSSEDGSVQVTKVQTCKPTASTKYSGTFK